MEIIHNSDEPGRLEELHSYRIMDTLPEACFDQLTLLAARVCEAPIALLSFIDENRQWFKSTYGLDIKELPRHVSACNQTIVEMGVYEIRDAEDASCPYKEYMLSHGLRFYAGVPIISESGYGMGSLCVIDTKPRELTAEQLETLRAIGDQVLENLEIRKHYQENLERLKELGEISSLKEEKYLKYTHERMHKAIAEIATGLNYRIRPFLLNIQSNSGLLKNNIKTIEDEARLKSIQKSAQAISHVLDNLDKFVAAEKEKWMKLVDLNSVIREVLQHLKHKLDDHSIDLRVTLEPEVRCLGNYAKLLETFYAVINNAVEAIDDRENGVLEISMVTQKREAIILVKDNGMGIDDTVKPFIFQPFFTTKSFMGVGVGLALAKSHMEEHAGSIELIQSKNPTIFKITIPVPSGT